MSVDSSPYTVRLPLPDLIVQGQDHTIQAPVYRDGALVAPSAATVSVFDQSNVEIVSGASATISGSIASYQISAATTASLTLSPVGGWRVEWTLTLAGETHVARNDAALVKRGLYPVISDVDINRTLRALDASSTTSITAKADHQDHLDEAWVRINLRLLGMGDRPNLIVSPHALREVHMALTCHLVFDDLATRLDDAYIERSKWYLDQYEDAWKRLTYSYDHDDDGQADSEGRQSPTRSVWLVSR